MRRTGAKVNMKAGRDVYYDEIAKTVPADCPCEEMSAEDPLFILYTSGSTGKPKGVLHTTGGYLVYTSITHQYVFDYHDGDIYWCTADVGWVTGHSYIVYGPLANGATTLMFEGVPNYPTTSRFWEVFDKHQVNIFYTAPTAIRALMQGGNDPVKKTSRKCLRLLGTVGEPINPEAWVWYYHVVGDGPLPDRRYLVADRDRRHPDHAAAGRHRTEAGLGDAAVLRRHPADRRRRRQSAGGRRPAAICASPIHGRARCARSMATTSASSQTYFSTYPGKYFTGDGCRRDEDGYYWITGRVDDVINVSGHRLGTAEVESALVAHPKVSEAAVVGYPHDIKGQGIYAYVTLMAGEKPSEELRKELVQLGAQGDRPDRLARPDPVRARPAEDALRQDHAAHPAQDRRGRIRQSRRHLDAGRSGGGRRSGQQPAEQAPGQGGGVTTALCNVRCAPYSAPVELPVIAGRRIMTVASTAAWQASPCLILLMSALRACWRQRGRPARRPSSFSCKPASSTSRACIFPEAERCRHKAFGPYADHYGIITDFHIPT